MYNPNICIFARFEILPQYRGHGLGKLIIKDNIEHIAHSCGLVVIRPFPLQLELEGAHKSDFEKSMGYDHLEKNEAKAFSSLRSYYKSLGYQSVKGFPNFMFLVPGQENPYLDDIEYEDYYEELSKIRKKQ